MSPGPKTDLTTHRGTRLIKGASAQERTQIATRTALSLGKRLMRVDLSEVVSPYIGETAKNIERLIGKARDSGAILLLDEADALFGKRTEIKDAHDRYANADSGAYQLLLSESGDTVLIGTGQDADSLARSKAAIPLQFKGQFKEPAVMTQPQQRSKHIKWPP
ncbi:MAG TPA: AAA family ATPase [Steroidobacteraceae bacterium]|jgi:SpoVK/Ycf46/Vps4 family AAA+-type ATPase